MATMMVRVAGQWELIRPGDVTIGLPDWVRGRALLETFEGFWDVSEYSGSGNLLNLGTSGSALDFVPGANAPTFLPYNGVPYFYIPNINFSVNVSAAQVPSISASMDIRIALAMEAFPPASTAGLMSKLNTTTSGATFSLELDTSGNLLLLLSANGTTTATFTSTATVQSAVPAIDDNVMWIARAVWVASTSIDFYVKTTTEATVEADAQSSTGWTQVGTQITTSVTGSLFSGGSTNLMFARSRSSGLTLGVGGKMWYAEMTVNGTKFISIQPAYMYEPTNSFFTTAEGRTAQLTRSAGATILKGTLVERPLFMFDGSNDVMTIADNATMDPGASSFSVGVAHRQWATLSSTGGFMGKAASAGSPGWQIISSSGSPGFTVTGATSGSTTVGLPPLATGVGEFSVFHGVRDVAADQVWSVSRQIKSAYTTDATVGGLSNAEVTSLGRRYTNGTFLAHEFYGAYYTNQVLTVEQTRLIDAYFRHNPSDV